VEDGRRLGPWRPHCMRCSLAYWKATLLSYPLPTSTQITPNLGAAVDEDFKSVLI